MFDFDFDADPPRYPGLDTYPNTRNGHTLRRHKVTGVGTCSCGGWQASGFSERSLIRTHQLHCETRRVGGTAQHGPTTT